MNNIRKTLSLGAAILAASVFSGAQAGNIVFNGEVTASTCKSEINGAQNATVFIQSINETAMSAATGPVGNTPFIVNITECSSTTDTPITVKFQSDQPVSAEGDLINQSTGTDAATGVNLRLLEANGTTQIVLIGQQIIDALPQTIPANGTSQAIEYEVAYVKETGGTVDVGAVTANVNYVVRYE